MTDELEHFDQQERSWSHLGDHGPRLAAEAAAILRDAPDAELGAGILEAGTREYAWFRAKIAESSGKEVTPPLLMGVVPREVLQALAGEQGAEWLRENALLAADQPPILVATKDGIRFGLQALPTSHD